MGTSATEVIMTIGALCNREVVVAGPDTLAGAAAELMRTHHVGDIVVVEERAGERHPVGLITDRDLVVEVMAQRIDPNAVTVRELMTRSLETVRDTTDFWDALSHMRACGVRRIPVVNARGGLEGIFTFDDALELIAEGLVDLVRVVSRQVTRERRVRGAVDSQG
jgi:CBS domain-containing protein